MTMLTSSIAIVVGILLLFGGGELFVAGSVALSLLLGIPQIVIGLTVVSMGTSAPELFVSLLATVNGNPADDAIALSNIVGSNIFNVMVVLGLSAASMPLRVKSRLIRRDVPVLLAVSTAVWGMASAGRITWQCGVALLTALVINLVWEVRTASENPSEVEEIDESERAPAPVAAAKLAAGLGLLVVGSQVLVKGAVAAATALGVSETVIGLTIVAAGTSMPELVTSLVAAYRGKADLAIGNVVGSNLLNQLVILGLCAVGSGANGLGVDPVLVSRDLPIMVATTLACLPIFWTHGVISRREGWLLFGLYVLYLVEQVLGEIAGADVVGPYRLAVLVVVLPLVLVFLIWQLLRWREARHARAD
ncbi:calcium/sodium antiporter [Synechococcus sp. FGCU-3]|nr:calcium/sodium antiporter [Synechococcus sp. FGCU3]